MIYVAPYSAPYLSRPRSTPPPSPNETALAFYDTIRSSPFPYDVGDDPAFFAAHHHNGQVTWGVCRPDVRCAIKPGDWVVFFSFEPDLRVPLYTLYKFVAALQVEKKVTHTALFQLDNYERYTRYLNLLIRPSGEGWEHHEPGLEPSRWHDDWMWRICQRRRLRKAEVVAAGQRHVRGGSLSLNGSRLPLADNYIILAAASAVICSQPPIVATHRNREPRETWGTDTVSKVIHNALFVNKSRGLRTSNPFQPHRHYRTDRDNDSWLVSIRDVLRI
ncbi:MAG: hypothetical protein ACREDR_07535 [Blastocatellia bacterium]